MRLVPVIALVDEQTLDRLAPLIADLSARWAAGNDEASEAWRAVQLANGWTPESIAWGLVIAAASQQDLEIVDGRHT